MLNVLVAVLEDPQSLWLSFCLSVGAALRAPTDGKGSKTNVKQLRPKGKHSEHRAGGTAIKWLQFRLSTSPDLLIWCLCTLGRYFQKKQEAQSAQNVFPLNLSMSPALCPTTHQIVTVNTPVNTLFSFFCRFCLLSYCMCKCNVTARFAQVKECSQGAWDQPPQCTQLSKTTYTINGLQLAQLPFAHWVWKQVHNNCVVLLFLWSGISSGLGDFTVRFLITHQ